MNTSKVVSIALDLLNTAKQKTENRCIVLHALSLASSMALAEQKTITTKSVASDLVNVT